MAIDPKHSGIAQWAIEEFASGFAAVIEGMVGTRPGVASELLTSAPPEPSPAFLWNQPFSGIPGEAFALASEQDTLVIGQQVMMAAGIEDSSPQELLSTFSETLGQAFSLLTRAMTTRLQREVTPATGKDAPATPPDLAWGNIRLTFSDQSVTILLGLNAQLLDSFVTEPKAAAQAAGAVAASTPSTPPAAPAPRSPVEDSKTFDLLLDVELPVSVSFGHAYVPLKEVLKLTTGSIVELSRAVIEPVDVVVNNCVIAKGEVVVVEGNFGVRIQQVISRSERLRSIQ